ncbi:transmembrane protein 156 isoform X3 [Zalophus californianus]|uniref:Transmembrane protein 156 isoform X3 n=1 Tax=Zalophus californianus TaxID=9704 RepID=A0A6J2DGC4_ZALCA|nr:transmembrane protein 156 isoform X3 [Zalophus californianus]
MTKTALFKLLLAIVIAFILLLPEYFKTPKGNILELSCLEVCLQPNFNYSLRSLNFSFVTFLKPVRESQTIMGIFLNHSNFQNFTRICQGITSELKMCSSCLACESKKSLDFISQEQTSKVLIMKGSTEVKANDFRSPCQHFNFTVAPILDPLEEYNITCNLKTHMRRPAIMEEDSPKEKSMNHTCRTMEYLNNCTHLSLHLEMDVKNFTCSMKITWYVLVLVVFIFFLILTLHKILESHRRMWKWRNFIYLFMRDREREREAEREAGSQGAGSPMRDLIPGPWDHDLSPRQTLNHLSHPGAPTSALLRGQDSEKLRTLNVRVISETKQRLPLTQVKKVLPPIPELEVTSMVHLQDQYTRVSF